MDEELHDEALARGLIRYCPICDGYEVTDKKVGVIGSGSHGVAEAVFLRGLHRRRDADRAGQARTTWRPRTGRSCASSASRRSTGRRAASRVHRRLRSSSRRADGHYTFDSVYPALGSDVHTELAGQIGVALAAKDGCILVDCHQRTNVPGVYAAGDVVMGLDQISHAMGEGGVAATAIRNDLAKVMGFGSGLTPLPFRREPHGEGDRVRELCVEGCMR